MSGTSCLFFLLAWANLSALEVRSTGQSTPSGVVGPTSGDSKVARPDRIGPDRSRSIELYRDLCLSCHEEDGRGASSRELMRRIPDFTRPEWHATRQDAHIVRVIREGRGSMPPMKDRLGTKDVVLLVTLIRNFQGGGQVIADGPEEEKSRGAPEPPKSAEPTEPNTRSIRAVSASASASAVPPSDASRGVFQRFCVSCHGADGRGDTMRAQIPGLPNFTSPDWHARRSDAQLATSILEGKGTAMPAFDGKLGEAQVRDVITYIRSFVSAKAPPSPKPSTDFRRRFEQLRDEFERLDRQYRALSR
jgi:mono/diheme cytochrome c family protein